MSYDHKYLNILLELVIDIRDNCHVGFKLFAFDFLIFWNLFWVRFFKVSVLFKS
jgi:hypothetical protein